MEHALPAFKQIDVDLAGLFESLQEILQLIVADCAVGEMVVLLDALDECAEKPRKVLIRQLTELSSNSPQIGSLKLLVTSRPSTPIRDQIWQGDVDLASMLVTGESEAEMEAISSEIDLLIQEIARKIRRIEKPSLHCLLR